MESRKNEFTLEPINNIMTGSILGNSKISPVPPQPSNRFLLMTGANFLLMTGADFLLI